MRKRALLIVMLAVIIATAAVVYAHWQDTLSIDAVVDTGTINPDWSQHGTNDDGNANGAPYNPGDPYPWEDSSDGECLDGDGAPITCPGDPAVLYPDGAPWGDPAGPGPNALRYDKAVAECFVDFDWPQGQGVDPPNQNQVYITINNGYPSYWCTVKMDLENNGSVPIKAQMLDLQVPPEIDLTFSGDTPFLTCGYQLDPGDHLDFFIHLHINNDALQDWQYTVSLDETWYNWNEWDEDNCSGFPAPPGP